MTEEAGRGIGKDCNHVIGRIQQSPIERLAGMVHQVRQGEEDGRGKHWAGSTFQPFDGRVLQLHFSGLEEREGEEGADQNPKICLPEKTNLFRSARDDFDRHGKSGEKQPVKRQGREIDHSGKDDEENPGGEGRRE